MLLGLCALGVVCLLAVEKKACPARPPRPAAKHDRKRDEPKPPPPMADVLPALASIRVDGPASEARPIVRPPVRVLPMDDGGGGGPTPAFAACAWRALEASRTLTVQAPCGARRLANVPAGAILTAIRPQAPPQA